MKILLNSVNPQQLSIIPRSYPANITYIIEKDGFNTSVTNIVSALKVGGRLVFSDVFDLEEDCYYVLSVYDGTTMIYRDKIFCTNQANYSINNGVYTESQSYDNEYATI